MSITYTPTTNFGSKDTLPANDPNKVIVGAEFTTEFASIQAAFAAAAPTSNPTFSGTSTFGTLNAGTTTVGTFTSTGIDDNATSTAITINAAEDVGLGTTTPDTILHLKDSNPILTMEHEAGQSARLYFEDATDGAWGGIRATYGASGATKEITLAPGNGAGDARFGGLSVTATKATIGGDFQQTNLDVVGLVTVTGAYPSVESRTPGSIGSRFVTTGSNMLMASLNTAGAYSADIYKVGLTETGPTRHTWTTSSAGSAMVLLDSGNLGLGTDTPGTALDVVGSGKSIRTRDTGANACAATMVASNNFAYLQVARTGGANPSRAELTARGNSSDLEFENFQGHIAKIDHQSTGEFSFQMDPNVNATMTFNTGTAEAMRITQVGTVGIGLSAPNSQSALHVAASSTNGLTGAGLLRLQNTQANACSMGFYGLANNWTMGAGNAGDFSVYNVTENTVPLYVDTQAPNQALRLEENSAHIKYNPAAAGEGQLQISANVNDVDGVLSFPLSGTSKGSIISNKPLSFHTGTTTNTTNERMRIDNLGNVGIGTDAPQTKLHVTQSVEDGSDGIRLSRSNSAATYTHWVDPTARYNIGYSNPATADPAEALLSLDGGNGRVGIGTDAPARKLHVNDAMRLEPTSTPTSPSAGDLYFDSTTNKLRCYDGTTWHDCF